jgi:hypothetical protein
MEESRFIAIQDCLFTRWICEAEDTMTGFGLLSVFHRKRERNREWRKRGKTHSGSLLGAHTIATLSGNMT